MKCKDVNDRLLFYLDNELTGREKQAIEDHLSTCSYCQKELEALRNTQNLLRQGFHSVATKTAPLCAWVELERRLAMLNETRRPRLSRVMSRIKGFVFWQPRWKPILAGVLCIAIIVSTVMFIPRLMGPSPELLASDIASDMPEVRALTGGEPSVEATKVSGTMGYVLSQGMAGDSTLAYVDLQKGTVIRLFRLTIPPLTEEDKANIIDIARADAKIQQLLDKGGAIGGVFPLSPRLRLELIDEEPTVWSEGILAGAVLRADNQGWVAIVDLGEGRVVDVSRFPTPSFPTWHIEAPKAPYSREELIDIAKSDTRVGALFDKGAEVLGAAMGGNKMADNGSVILKLGEAVWSVRIDLPARTVTMVEPIPAARHGKANLFKPEQ